ncbi:MAG: hypothetical protein Q8R67_09770 [Rhodoferax sp.]|nr:hypothetical protein [Rhodoferax sp.]MDP3651957.1 hypothetical protein [Rhodoferax sp.]
MTDKTPKLLVDALGAIRRIFANGAFGYHTNTVERPYQVADAKLAG